MISWQKLQKMSENDPWLVRAIEMLKMPDDNRPFRKRVGESIAFVAFKPFANVRPSWKGVGEWYPFFDVTREDVPTKGGVWFSSNPVVVCHYGNYLEYMFIQLLPNPGGASCTISESMIWYLRNDGIRHGNRIVFDAVVRPLQVHVSPHDMFVECYEVFKFPNDFNFEEWVKPYYGSALGDYFLKNE